MITTSQKDKIQIPTPEFHEKLHKWGYHVLRNFDEHPEIRHRVIVWHRRARKTTLGLNLSIRECVQNRNDTYAVIEPTFRQAKAILWRDPMMLKRYLPREVLRKPFNESELVGEFRSGSVLHIGGADDPERWKGMGCKGWILDEFALMRNGRQLYEETIYPIIRENKGWVMFSYTPKGRNHGWEFWKRSQDDKLWAGWFLPVTKSGLLTADEILQAKKDMPEHLFAQELMCEFLEAGGGIIKRVDEAISGTLVKPQRGQRYVMGIDLAKREDWTVLTVLNCETRHLDAWERFQKIDYSFQKEKIARLSKEYYNPLLIVDSTGVGDPIVDDLKNMGLNVRDDGFKFTGPSKKQLIEKLILAVEDRRVTFPDIPELIDELKDFEIDEKGRYSAPEGLHDDCVISLALAVEGLGAEIYATAADAEESYIPASERFKHDN